MENKYGTSIRRYRMEKGLTQADLARSLYVTPQAVSKWEKGETTPGMEMTEKICEVLEISPNDIYGFWNTPQSETVIVRENTERKIVSSSYIALAIALAIYFFGYLLMYIFGALLYMDDVSLPVAYALWGISGVLLLVLAIRNLFLLKNAKNEYKASMTIFATWFFGSVIVTNLFVYIVQRFILFIKLLGNRGLLDAFYEKYILSIIILILIPVVFIIIRSVLKRKFD